MTSSNPRSVEGKEKTAMTGQAYKAENMLMEENTLGLFVMQACGEELCHGQGSAQFDRASVEEDTAPLLVMPLAEAGNATEEFYAQLEKPLVRESLTRYAIEHPRSFDVFIAREPFLHSRPRQPRRA